MTLSAPAPEHTPTADRILNKALEFFSKKGYEATSVREICEAARITKPSLYHFFGSKEGVYRAIVDGALEEFRGILTEALTRPVPVCERLHGFARAYFEKGRRQPERTRFILSLIHNPSTAAPPTDFPRFQEEISGVVGAAIEEGVRGGEFAPGAAPVRTLAYMGALGQAVRGHVLLGRPVLNDALADELVECVLNGWRARTP